MITEYHVYADTIGAIHEGNRKTLHNARRFARSLRRRGFGTCVRMAVSEGGKSWTELVEAHEADGYQVYPQ